MGGEEHPPGHQAKGPDIGALGLIWTLKDLNFVPLCCYSQTRSNPTISALLSVLLLVVTGLGPNRLLVAGLSCDDCRRGLWFLKPLLLSLTFAASLSLPLLWCRGVDRRAPPSTSAPARRPSTALLSLPLSPLVWVAGLGFENPPVAYALSEKSKGLGAHIVLYLFLLFFIQASLSTKLASSISNVLF